MRMDQIRIHKYFKSRRDAETRRLRWLENVENDLRELKLKIWRPQRQAFIESKYWHLKVLTVVTIRLLSYRMLRSLVSWNLTETSEERNGLPSLLLVYLWTWRSLRIWRWRQCFPLKHRWTSIGIHDFTSLNSPQCEPQIQHSVSITNTNRLMLSSREIISVYCDNHMEHINTLCGQNVEALYIRIQFVPHRKHITSPLQRPTG
jgi:hypothetical protein